MKKRLLIILTLMAYSVILTAILVFKNFPTIRIDSVTLDFAGTNTGHGANIIPFKTISEYLFGNEGIFIASINILGNILLLIPIGFLVPCIYRNTTWKKILALAFATGFAIELSQVILKVGIFDIDDVILNALGVMIGYWMFLIFTKWIREKKYKNIVITITALLVLAAGFLFIIYPKAHQHENVMINNNHSQSDSNGHRQNIISSDNDPCKGSGGTGQIVNVGESTMAIKLNDGRIQLIKLTDRTVISNAGGTIAIADLKTGNRVTVVIDESETAVAVLVCTGTTPEK